MGLYSFGSHRYNGLKFKVFVTIFLQIERGKEVEIFESKILNEVCIFIFNLVGIWNRINGSSMSLPTCRIIIHI